MKSVFAGIAKFILVCAIFYGMYWITKTGSFFYEDMVQQTVREMVQPEYLNKKFLK